MNPLNDEHRHDRSSSEGSALENRQPDNKENVTPNKKEEVPLVDDKEKSAPTLTNGSSAVLKPAASHHRCLPPGKVHQQDQILHQVPICPALEISSFR